MPLRSAAELVQGRETTWQGMQAAIASWTEADWQQTYPGEERDEPATINRHWVIWHLNEHDRHRDGAIKITRRMHGLPAPDLYVMMIDMAVSGGVEWWAVIWMSVSCERKQRGPRMTRDGIERLTSPTTSHQPAAIPPSLSAHVISGAATRTRAVR